MQKSFLQSKEWEEFQKSVGNQTFRIDDVLLIKKSLPMKKNYFYVPRANIDINKVAELAKKENCIFLRIEPMKELEIETLKLKIQRSVDILPSQTLILDLTQTEEEILKNMHQKTRYNIRLAGKKGVEIKESNDIDKFWKLMQETTERDKFRAHDKSYYEKMIASKIVKLYIAEYEGKILTAGIFVFYDDTVTYLHGASTHEHKNVMAPYLLHWEMIKLAKKQGCKYYDFYGINEQKWPGVTRFKKGFNGTETNYPGTFDIVFNKIWYGIYKIVRGIKRLI